MRHGLINNPKKELSLDFSGKKIINSLRNVPAINKKYSILKDDKVLNIVVLKKKGIVDILNHYEFQFSFEEISENKTKMIIECSRLIGAFDTAGEITEVTLFMDDILEAMSSLLSEDNIEEYLIRIKAEKEELKEANKLTPEQLRNANIIIWTLAAIFVLCCVSFVLA